MQWIIFGILAMVVVTGVRRMAREGKDAPSAFDKTAQAAGAIVQDTVQCPKCGSYVVKGATCSSCSAGVK